MGTKEKNKKGLSIAKVYLSKQILIILCIVAVVLVAWFGTRKVVSIDNKTTKLGFENIGNLQLRKHIVLKLMLQMSQSSYLELTFLLLRASIFTVKC